ncbi:MULTISPECIES: hypothetical protein [unclassified Zobellia]|uniref:hypothetical protein n=1 Tax=unclassified Zobellia TaxID=2620635 RepID=UPI001C0700C0|nr:MULTISPECIES: hypothetical protein [unclassified Zobellia]MBU2974349.1 hypothetical protein [Zobellia sp. B3R18]MDO6818597.1 hypothetical protein [Zobellia sp. 1_MG-2023]
MKVFLKAISYVFHPLFIPVAGTLAYFLITPKYSPIAIQSANVLPIFILTVIIPIIVYFILKNLGLVTSIFMSSARERRYPIYIHITLLLFVVYKVIPNTNIAELHFYFVGLIIASLTTLITLFFKLKISMHLMGMGSLVMFLTALSIHFEVNITLGLSIFTLLTGLVATSRLYLKAHTRAEIILGFLVGFLSQLMIIRFWL